MRTFQFQRQVSKTFTDSEKRSKNVEIDRKQKSKSEGCPVLYEEKWYAISSLPRLCYHHHLVSNIAEKIRALRSTEETRALLGVKRVRIYLAGEITTEAEILITSSKGSVLYLFCRIVSDVAYVPSKD
ncbi:uncharacterized protein LOC134241395 [Saccostrea cucullata]|uniref:uncharacterized protein LOC134241395 n=1 Tax=Saccostrea cuccullata TaxID=36930 RepID=UPI002ED692E9